MVSVLCISDVGGAKDVARAPSRKTWVPLIYREQPVKLADNGEAFFLDAQIKTPGT